MNINSSTTSSKSRTSSRRSSTATLRRPLSLRSLTGTRNRAAAPPSVSIVFAQPEQGKPLESAVSNLPQPPPARAPEGIEGEAGETEGGEEDTMAKKRDAEEALAASTATIRPLDVPSDTSKRQKTAVEPLGDPAADVVPDRLAASPGAKSLKDAAADALSIASTSSSGAAKFTTPSTSGSSWFGSISRSGGNTLKERAKSPRPSAASVLAPPTEEAPPPEPTPPPAPATAPAAPSPPRSIPTATSTAQAHNRKRSWFSSRPNSPAPPSSLAQGPSSLPSASNMNAAETTAPINTDMTYPSRPPLSSTSSIDTSVPSPPLSVSPSGPSCPSLPPRVSPDTSRDASLSSLNPTTSRFMLSIPLLGRPKIPLEKAVAQAQAEDVRTIGQKTPVTEALAVSQIEDIREDGYEHEVRTADKSQAMHGSANAAALTEPLKAQAHVDDTDAAPAPASSWWDYVGWSGSRLGPENVYKDGPPATSSSAEDVPMASAPEIEVQEAPEPTLDEASQTTIRAKKQGEKETAQSVFSNETALSGGSWLAPWTWYSASAEASGSATPAGQAAVVDGAPSQPAPEPGKEVDADGQTQSERVKEEALAREQAQAEAQTPSNPIEGTIKEHRAGWASLFMSKAFVGKTITEKGEKEDEEGMEVMDVPELEEGGEAEDKERGRAVTGVGSAAARASAVARAERASGKTTPAALTKGRSSSVPALGKDAKGEAKKNEAEGEMEKTQKGGGTPKGREPKKKGPPELPLTDSDSVKKRTSSPAPSKKSGKSGNTTPTGPHAVPNLVLPTFKDTFLEPPRSVLPRAEGRMKKGLKYLSNALQTLAGDEDVGGKGKGRDAGGVTMGHFAKSLPRAWDVIQGGLGQGTAQRGKREIADALRGAKKVVVIGVHGWFYNNVLRSVLGEPTGTSAKLASMMVQAITEFEEHNDVKLEKVTSIPLEGEGVIDKRVEKLYKALTENEEWMSNIREADVIFFSAHSQGSVVSTHILNRLINDGHVRTTRSAIASAVETAASGVRLDSAGSVQRVCCLCLCGIHMGPLRYLSASSFIQPYLQYFESAAAIELFEFQNTESDASKAYIASLRNVVDHGTKMVYIASLDDQVVPVYSGLFTGAAHPLILRAIYIDGDAYSSSDFLSNLTVLLIRILNAGLSDSRLLLHLSEATAGSLSGVGHSSAYEELATFRLAVDYLFLVDGGQTEHAKLDLEHFSAATEQNDYEIPWALRDLIADERVAYYFADQFAQLRDQFDDWRPKTTILRDIKRKLQPIQRLSAFASQSSTSPSKL